MADFQLVAEPTFKAKVEIPVAGGKPFAIEFTFKHMKASAYQKFLGSEFDAEIDRVSEMVCGWDRPEVFSRESLETLLENRMGAALAIFRKYNSELTGQRVGN